MASNAYKMSAPLVLMSNGDLKDVVRECAMTVQFPCEFDSHAEYILDRTVFSVRNMARATNVLCY